MNADLKPYKEYESLEQSLISKLRQIKKGDQV